MTDPRIEGRLSWLGRRVGHRHASRLVTGGAWAFAGRAGMSVAALASNALLTRLLPPAQLGMYFVAFSVVLFGSVVSSLGLGQSVVRLVAQSMGQAQYGRARYLLRQVFLLGGMGAAAGGLGWGIAGPLVTHEVFHLPLLGAASGLVGTWMAMMTIQNLLAESFRAFHDIREASLFGGSLSGLCFVIALGLVWLMHGGSELVNVLLLAAASVLMSVVVGTLFLRRRIVSIPSSNALDPTINTGEVLRVAGPVWVTNLALVVLVQASVWVIGAFGPPADVAAFGSAMRLVTLVAMPLVIVNAVVPPLIAEMYSQGHLKELERILRGTATLAGIPAFAALVGVMIFADPILGLVFGDFYRTAAPVLIVLSLGQLANVWSGTCGLTLVMTGHQTSMMVITLVTASLVVGGALAVVGAWGTLGVAIVTAVGMVLQNMLMLVAARLKTGLWTHVGISTLLVRSSRPRPMRLT
jgi:O-antigen/teichoic acid export membrane protein